MIISGKYNTLDKTNYQIEKLKSVELVFKVSMENVRTYLGHQERELQEETNVREICLRKTTGQFHSLRLEEVMGLKRAEKLSKTHFCLSNYILFL